MTLRTLLLAATLCAPVAALAATAGAYKHVLLISIDGLHGIDLQNYVNDPAHAKSTLALLAKRGVTYQNAYTTAPSDSFPGMIAQVTGASPLTADIFYDDSYDRSVWPAGSNCQGPAGAETNLAEALDRDQSRLDAGGTLGDVYSQIDPAKLPLALLGGKCKPVYPHHFLKANTIFEVAKSVHLRTAWADKHPAYEILQGPTGQGIDDLYTPEINSNNILGGAGDNTQSFNAVSTYDQNKVDAVLHQIDGYNSTGTAYAGVPAIFGMNFQAVSVGQKLAVSGPTDPAGLVGGYSDSNATPRNALSQELAYVDGALGQFVAELQRQNVYDSTLIIVSAKHAQSPIDPAARTTRDDGAFFPQTPGYAFEIADDEVLLWLQPGLQVSQRAAALAYLKSVAAAANIQQIYDGTKLPAVYKNALHDHRTPDFIGVAVHGTIYTTGSKLSEHGGFSDDDRHVAMVVSGPGLAGGSAVTSPVLTTQIAPTILTALGIDPSGLTGVQKENTQVLPGLFK